MLKRIVSEKENRLPSLKQQTNWRAARQKLKKSTNILSHIFIISITELNELIYAGEKLVR